MFHRHRRIPQRLCQPRQLTSQRARHYRLLELLRRVHELICRSEDTRLDHVQPIRRITLVPEDGVGKTPVRGSWWWWAQRRVRRRCHRRKRKPCGEFGRVLWTCLFGIRLRSFAFLRPGCVTGVAKELTRWSYTRRLHLVGLESQLFKISLQVKKKISIGRSRKTLTNIVFRSYGN